MQDTVWQCSPSPGISNWELLVTAEASSGCINVLVTDWTNGNSPRKSENLI